MLKRKSIGGSVLCFDIDDCIDSDVMDFKGGVDKIAEQGRHIEFILLFFVKKYKKQ